MPLAKFLFLTLAHLEILGKVGAVLEVVSDDLIDVGEF